MAIGEFGGAPVTAGGNGALLSAPLYWFYEMTHAALNPSRAWADATRLFFKNPINPLSSHDLRQIDRRSLRTVRTVDATLQPAGMADRFQRWSAASVCRCSAPQCGSGRSAG